MRTREVKTSEQWREWLAAHHSSETGHATMAYHDAVAEALCFGCVDSLIKRLDDARYARKFTPRNPDSRWSDINHKRYAKLKADGRLAPAGASRAPNGRGYAARPSLPATVPRYIQEALREHSKAARAFELLTPFSSASLHRVDSFHQSIRKRERGGCGKLSACSRKERSSA